MAERATVYQGVQVGIETVPGTAVPANKRLQLTFMKPKPTIPVDPYGPTGSKFDVTETLQKEMTEYSIDGKPGYEDLAYILSSLLRVPTGTFTYNIDPYAADTVNTFTVETGNGIRAERSAGVVVTDLEISITKAAVSMTGKAMGQPQADGATITAAPTALKKVAISPKHVKIYVGDSVGALAKLDRCLQAKFGIAGRHLPVFTLDADQPSYSATVEGKPKLSAELVVQYNSVAAGYMADLRAAKQKFMRILAVGPEYSTGNNYRCQITFPFVFSDPDESDVDGQWAATFKLLPKLEDSFGSAVEVVLANSLGGL